MKAEHCCGAGAGLPSTVPPATAQEKEGLTGPTLQKLALLVGSKTHCYTPASRHLPE